MEQKEVLQSIKIRKANASDIESLFILKNGTLTREEIQKRLDQQGDGDIDYYIILDQGQLVGHVVLNWRGKSTHPEYPDIVDVFVAERERGKGYGTIILEFCESAARDKGFLKIGLAVNPTVQGNVKTNKLKIRENKYSPPFSYYRTL